MGEQQGSAGPVSRRVAFAGAAAAAVGVAEVMRSGEAGASPAQDWSTVGNSITSTDFLGATSVQPLIFKTAATANSPVERMRIAAAGNVSIGTTSVGGNLNVAAASGKIGVRVYNTTTNGTGAGVYVSSSSAPAWYSVNTAGNGVRVVHNGTDGTGAGILVQTKNSVGVMATSQSAAGIYGVGASVGLYGSSPGDYGTGVQGSAQGDTSYGVQGSASGSGGWGGYFVGNQYGVYAYGAQDGVYCYGNMQVTGTINPSAVAVTIDHPVEPTTKWLAHSVVDSPEMKTVYDGTVTLGSSGLATVTLPSYVEHLNAEFRYQLTCIGGFAEVYVSSEIKNGTFTIAGGKPGVKVSWAVTGVRRDDYARANPLQVERPKAGTEVGTRRFVPAGSAVPAFDPLEGRARPARIVMPEPAIGQDWVAPKG